MSLPKVGVQLEAEGANAFLRAMEDGTNAVRGIGRGALDAGPMFDSMDKAITGALMHVGALAVDTSLMAGRALLGFGADALSLAGDFESTVNSFASVAGPLDEAGLSLKDFENKFLDLGAATKFSANEAAQAAVELAKGGLPIEQIMGDATEATLALASAGELDLAPAATIVAKQLGVWGDQGVTATDAANQLAKAANASTVNVDDLALGLANVGGTAKVAGLTFDETVQAMALLAPGFSSAADAGTSFKTMLSSLVGKSDNAIKAMSELGLYSEETGSAFYDATGSFIGMEEATRLLSDATSDLSEKSKLEKFGLIFGSDAIRAAAIFAEQGADGFNRMGASMNTAGDVFAQAAKKNEGYKASVREMQGSFENLQIVLAQKVLPTLTPFVDLVTDGINVFFEMARTGGDAAGAMDTFGASLTEMSPTLGKWFDVLTTGNGLLDDLAYIAGDILSRFGPLGTTAQNLINIFLRGEDTFANWTFLGRSLDAVFGDELGGALLSFFQTVDRGIDTVAEFAAIIADAGINSIEMRDYLGGLAETIGPVIADAVPQVRQAFLDWALAAADWVLDSMPMILENLGLVLQGLIGWAAENAITFGEQMLDFGMKLTEWIAPRLPALGEQLGEFFNKMVNWVVEKLPEWGEKLKLLGDKAIQWVKDALPGLGQNLGEFGGALLGWIIKTIGDITPKLLELAGKFIAWIATDVVPELPAAAEAIWTALDTFIDTAAERAVIELANLGARFNEWVEKDVIPVLPGELAKIWDNIVAWVTDTSRKIVAQVKAIGEGIIDGIIAGAGALGQKLYDALAGSISGAIDDVKSFFGIQSPSEYTIEQIGRPLMDGIIEGVTAAAPSLETAFTASISTAMDAGLAAALTGGQAITGALAGVASESQAIIAALQTSMGEISGMGGSVRAGIGQFGGGGGHRIQPHASPGQMFSGATVTNNGPQITFAPTYNSAPPAQTLDFATVQAFAQG